MPKHERALALFPSFYDAMQPNGVLYQVAQRLAEPLERADTSLFRIQRAHRLQVAEDLGDLVLLAAALNLTPHHFDDILSEPPLEMGEGGHFRQRLIDAYAGRLDAARDRVRRVARLHLDGLGTPWAMLEGAAIFLGADVRAEPGAPRVHHEDENGFSHWADVSFPRASGAPRARIYLHENPLRRHKSDTADRYPLGRWSEQGQHVEAPAARVVIQGIGDRAVLPCLFCASTGEGIAFNGIIPDGATLIIDQATGATINGRQADDFVSFDVGGRFDIAGQFDPRAGATGRFIIERNGPQALFNGDVSRLVEGPRLRRTETPMVPVGTSEWVFTVAIGVLDVSLVDFAVFATPSEPVGIYGEPPGWDATVFDYPPSARAGIGWDERMPCALKVLVPPRLPLPSEPGVEPQWIQTDLGRISTLLDRVRPAGIRAFVDVARDDWLLGESVIRVATPTGSDGVDRRTTAIHAPGTDRFIPLDPATLNS